MISMIKIIGRRIRVVRLNSKNTHTGKELKMTVISLFSNDGNRKTVTNYPTTVCFKNTHSLKELKMTVFVREVDRVPVKANVSCVIDNSLSLSSI